jgi:hypothetical protein
MATARPLVSSQNSPWWYPPIRPVKGQAIQALSRKAQRSA